MKYSQEWLDKAKREHPKDIVEVPLAVFDTLWIYQFHRDGCIFRKQYTEGAQWQTMVRLLDENFRSGKVIAQENKS